jgi:hypothetical protein
MSLRLLGACLILALGQGSVHAQTQQTRVAVVVGNNQGRDPARTLRYAEAEAGKLAALLRSAGDFDNVITVKGARREVVEEALAAARAQLNRARAEGKRTLFLFYYSGHGDQEALELGSSRLPLRDLRSYLEQLSGADVRVAFVDACQSGALTGVKGGRRAPGYEIHLADPGSVKGMAIVTSSTANELSQESDDLAGSFFTHNIMAGLRGAADTSHDGQVTLGEVYQFAFRRTLASTAASLVGGQHPTYDYRMSGAGDVILARTRPNDARLVFPRETGVTYTVVNRARGEVIAELGSTSGEDLYLALPAGEYRVVRRQMRRIIARRAGHGSPIRWAFISDYRAARCPEPGPWLGWLRFPTCAKSAASHCVCAAIFRPTTPRSRTINRRSCAPGSRSTYSGRSTEQTVSRCWWGQRQASPWCANTMSGTRAHIPSG